MILEIVYIYCKIWTTLQVLLYVLCVVLFQVDSEVMKNKDDFTVVLQPFTDRLTFPVNRFNGTDLSYIAPDCFHLSQRGYARRENMTIRLWIITIIFTFSIFIILTNSSSFDMTKRIISYHCIAVANALWNNMMEPVGQKTINWSKELDRFICPTDELPYIRTWKNSMPWHQLKRNILVTILKCKGNKWLSLNWHFFKCHIFFKIFFFFCFS